MVRVVQGRLQDRQDTVRGGAACSCLIGVSRRLTVPWRRAATASDARRLRGQLLMPSAQLRHGEACHFVVAECRNNVSLGDVAHSRAVVPVLLYPGEVVVHRVSDREMAVGGLAFYLAAAKLRARAWAWL